MLTTAPQNLEQQLDALIAKHGLTAEERETLNAAEQIIKAHFNRKPESILISFHAGWESFSVCYFTPNMVQHSSLWRAEGDNSFAGKLDQALFLRADEDGRADQIKADRIATLKAELIALSADPLTEQVA